MGTKSRQRWLQRLLWAGSVLLALWAAVWGGMALQAQMHPHAMAWVWIGLWGFAWLAAGASAWRLKRLRCLWTAGAVLVLAIGTWWSTIEPQAQRQWAADVAHLVRMETDKDRPSVVHLRQVRNFDWRSETDFTPRWESRSYDLSALASVDVALSYWMGPAIAHTLVSFGFADGQHLVFSIEIRKEVHEQFDALAGFFKQYEMALVAADEHDILAVRTNVRGENVHLYRVNMSQASMRDLFMAYAQQASALHAAPRFYHTLTANCTTIVWQLARRIGQTWPLDWRLLASGYLPEYLRDAGALASDAPIEVQRQQGHIDARAQSWQRPEGMSDAQASADFSRHIRQGS